MKQIKKQRFDENNSPIHSPRDPECVHLLNQIRTMQKIASTSGILPGADDQGGPTELMKYNFCVGEVHTDSSPKKFLIQSMATLVKHGFSVIFMEHLPIDCSPTLETNPDLLKRLTDLDINYEQHSEYNFTNLVKEAWKHGIKIISLEESCDMWKLYPNGPERMVSLNLNAKKVIEETARDFGGDLKWCALVGSAHLRLTHGVPGICEIISAKSVLVSDSHLIPGELKNRVNVFLPSSEDMSFEAILAKNLQKIGQASSKEGSTEHVLPYSADGKDDIPKPLSTIEKADDSSAIFAKTLVGAGMSNPPCQTSLG